MKPLVSGLAAAGAMLVACSCAPPVHNTHQQIDAQIEAEIARTKAIDNHAHPMRVYELNNPDTEYDALPVDVMQPSPLPIRLDPTNTEFAGAFRALYGYGYDDVNPEHLKKAVAEKQRIMREQGDRYPDWVLDKLGIDIMFANRVAMGRGLDPARFKWVPFDDALMYPFNNEGLGKRDPDRKNFFAAEQKLLKRYLAEAGLSENPPTFDQYLQFVTRTLESEKNKGAIAVKFEAVYLRPLDFGDPQKADAERIYSIYEKTALPTNEEYKTVQDYIFRYIAHECGRLGLPVHFHLGLGAGGYFGIAGSNPLLLEPILNDPSLRGTKFVLLHGGWPWTKNTQALLTKPNVWTDFSLQTLFFYPRTLSGVLRDWLEFMPNKILFATDSSPLTPDIGWEETGWLSETTGREALGLALTGMLRDGEITRDRAIELVHMVLRDNARKLYGIR
jgi:uncharacterized protein